MPAPLPRPQGLYLSGYLVLVDPIEILFGRLGLGQLTPGLFPALFFVFFFLFYIVFLILSELRGLALSGGPAEILRRRELVDGGGDDLPPAELPDD